MRAQFVYYGNMNSQVIMLKCHAALGPLDQPCHFVPIEIFCKVRGGQLLAPTSVPLLDNISFEFGVSADF